MLSCRYFSEPHDHDHANVHAHANLVDYDHDDCVLNVYDFYGYDPYKISHASVHVNFL